MKFGILNKFIFLLFVVLTIPVILYAEEKIESVPLINLDDLSPTFEEEKSELEKKDSKATIDDNDVNSEESTQPFIKGKIYWKYIIIFNLINLNLSIYVKLF